VEVAAGGADSVFVGTKVSVGATPWVGTTPEGRSLQKRRQLWWLGCRPGRWAVSDCGDDVNQNMAKAAPAMTPPMTQKAMSTITATTMHHRLGGAVSGSDSRLR